MASDMFIKIGDIKGEAKDKSHKDEIDVLAWSWGMSQTGSAHAGPGQGAGKAAVNDLSFTKFVDKSTPTLMQHCLKGTHIGEATLVCRRAGDKPLEYYKVKMTDLIVTSVSTGGGSGEEILTENVTLNFAKVDVFYQAQSKTGGADGGPVELSFSIEENE